MSVTIKVLFLAAEAEPYIKIGGLADVAGTLPLVLRALTAKATRGVKLDVRLALPLHSQTRVRHAALKSCGDVSVYRRGGNVTAGIYETSRKKMPVYFIKGDLLTQAPSVYSTDPAPDREKYTFFCMAVLKMLHDLDWYPDIIHANDWHTALALYALRVRRSDPLLRRVRTLITIHNLPYMGGDGTDVLTAYGLTPPSGETLPAWARKQALPLGLWSADAIVPVSPSYAREILTPEFGCGLDTYLGTRTENITGILNGLDLNAFDPATDKDLAGRYSVETLERRTANRRELQRRVGLPLDTSTPILAMVGRLDIQKGLDIALEALETLPAHAWRLIILGSGDAGIETLIRNMENQYPDRVRGIFRYDAPLSRLIYGGADILLMPSRYEPCGLAQMIAMHYGCIPVVRATGGLKDTVHENKTGYLFHDADPQAMQKAILQALEDYSNKEKWQIYQRNGMLEDFSWARSARQYAIIYKSLMAVR